MQLLKKYALALIGIIAGSIGGYAYYYYVGCTGDTCPITSKPLNTVIYGAVMGLLIFTSFQKDKKQNNI